MKKNNDLLILIEDDDELQALYNQKPVRVRNLSVKSKKRKKNHSDLLDFNF